MYFSKKLFLFFSQKPIDKPRDMQYNSISTTMLKQKGFNYVALGHIHKNNIEKNSDIIYPGSTISLGFDEAGTALMLAIFAIQDSFGTACNVTGDGALTLMLTGYAEKHNIEKQKISVEL